MVGLAGCAGDPGPCGSNYGSPIAYVNNPAELLLIPFMEAGCAILGNSSTAEMTPEEKAEWQAAYDAAVAAGEENPKFALIRKEREEQYCLHGQVEYCNPNTSVALAAGAGALAGSKSPSEGKHDPTQSQPVGPVKVGLLPPGFFQSGPYNAENEGQMYSEIRRYIASNPGFDLSFDYAARYGVGSLDAHAVWRGSVVKKVPDKAKIRVIGEELGADILVLTWIRVTTGSGDWAEISLYVFDVASGKMHQKTAHLDQAKQLVESTFALANLPTEGKTVLQ
jgi:hypothetical protein